MPERKQVTPEDLLQLQFVDAVAVSPDGSRVVYQVRSIDPEKDGYESHLWLVPMQGGDPRRITFGEHKNGSAAWSPDGKTIAFVSDRRDKTQQIFRLSLDGGEAERLTDLDGRIGGLSWSPDGSKISFCYRPADPTETGHLPGSAPAKLAADAKAEKKDRKPPTFMHITRLHYKEDGQGFLPRSRFHVHVLDVATGDVRALTSGEWDHGAAAWSPDGKWLVAPANRLPDSDYHATVSDLWLIPSTGGEPRNLTPQPGAAFAPAWSPDGSQIAFLANEDEGDAWGVKNIHVWTVSPQGGPARNLTPDFDRTALDLMGTDLRDFHDPYPPVWSVDGTAIHYLVSDEGSTHLYSVSAKGGTPRRVTKGALALLAVAGSKQGNDLAAIRCDHTDAGTVGRLDSATGAFAPLARPTAKLFDTLAVKYPMILEIHGGPRVQYGACFFHEFQMLASAGLYVLFSNPRGAQGYGEAFTRQIVVDWGGPDYEDLMRVVDDALRRYPEIDPARLGVTGGSYGGYMTNWIVGHTNRFKAAVTQRSVVDLKTLLLAGDFSDDAVPEFGDQPWRDSPDYRRMSPITYVENIRTPLLILHSLEDHRCPVEEAEQLYTSLKLLRRDVEMVLFPAESHGLSRGGTPSRRVARLTFLRDWFVRHLAPEPAPRAAARAPAAAEPAMAKAK
ncbi:MAG: S9 family peptidase [Candidatus Eisenbacteria bacterium]|uniref:S9 family peptidase n=1 Tax=Eiseniibacteriota bacterium TaxID=2212470 RepID=A0A538TC44_UNCEI|nr:MAG: S9 family peptidase [Candidatus Eisenbacteria bacterium]